MANKNVTQRVYHQVGDTSSDAADCLNGEGRGEAFSADAALDASGPRDPAFSLSFPVRRCVWDMRKRVA
jgi:hypothetical protein